MCLSSVTDVCRRRKREIGETGNDLREVLRASNGARCGERKTSAAQKFPQTQTLLQRAASSLTFSPRKYSLIVVIRTAAGMKSGGGTQVCNSYRRGRSGQLKGRNFRKWNPNKEYTKLIYRQQQRRKKGKHQTNTKCTNNLQQPNGKLSIQWENRNTGRE